MLILCKAWAPRRRLCDVQNGRKAFVSPASHLISISVSEKQDFKKVMLILAVFSWRRREMLFFFVQTQETIKADFSQITAEVTAQRITVSGEWQAHATSPYAAFFCHSRSSSVCEKEEDWQCVFPGCTSVERVCRSLSVSVSFTVKSKTEVVISRSHAGSLYLNKAAFVLFETLSASFVHASDDLHWKH